MTFKKIVLVITLFFTTTVFAKDAILYNWVEMGPNNAWIVRAITTAKTCPKITVNNKQILMDVHNAASPQFNVTTCQKTIPNTTTQLIIDHHSLALPKKDPKKIVLIGDTGCRLKTGATIQSCDNPKQWPFSLVAKNAAAWHPDLVIHVGDYYYRESACPKGNKGCAGSPHGDDWPTWQADFFKPAQALLKAAPWVMTRGNHEDCTRGGEGWRRFLDPFAFQKCLDHSPLYDIQLGKVKVFIIDSANANDFIAPPAQVNLYENYLSTINKDPAQEKWIISHKPFWFVYNDNQLNKNLQQHFMNTLETAWHNLEPKNVKLVFSGHIHRFQTLNFDNERPAQVIVGASGTELDAGLKHHDIANFNVANADVAQGISISHFGYMTMEQTATGWIAQMRSPDSKVLANCTFANKSFICQETALAANSLG